MLEVLLKLLLDYLALNNDLVHLICQLHQLSDPELILWLPLLVQTAYLLL